MYLKLSVPKRQISRIPKVKRAFYHDTSFDSLEEADLPESVDLHLPWVKIAISCETLHSIGHGDLPTSALVLLNTSLQVMAEDIVYRGEFLYTVKVAT